MISRFRLYPSSQYMVYESILKTVFYNTDGKLLFVRRADEALGGD